MTTQTQTPPDGSVLIELPWPPSSLSGHSDKHFWRMRPIIKKHRTWAAMATLAADISTPEGDGDIRVSATFYPPDKRSDRVNMPARLKPYWDGIADALKVNDRRFLPSYHFAEPVSNPRVVVRIG
jgi:crossover junction endodeoxyribonuclease RusA